MPTKFNDFRKLIIYTDPQNYSNLNQIIMNKRLKEEMADRNLRIDIKKSDSNKIDLYGYDKNLKYSTNNITEEEFKRIFEEIDKMPMRKEEMRMKDFSDDLTSMTGGDSELYTDRNPKTTLKGTGYKDEKKARETIKLVKSRSKTYQKYVINTMYYRAKHHKYQTADMRKAMKIFKKWLKNK